MSVCSILDFHLHRHVQLRFSSAVTFSETPAALLLFFGLCQSHGKGTALQALQIMPRHGTSENYWTNKAVLFSWFCAFHTKPTQND